MSDNNFKEYYKDDLFTAIEKNSKLKKLFKKIKIFIQYLTLFSWIFIILALISIFFYPQKQALILFGLTSILHVVFAPLALIAFKKQNRYLLFSFCLTNLIWLASISFAFLFYISIGIFLFSFL